MFTSEELYEACRQVLLRSLGTYYTDAHYHSVVTPTGTFRLSNYLDVFTPDWHRNEEQKSQRHLRLVEGRSCFGLNLPAHVSSHDCMIVRPRDLADNFMKRAFLSAAPHGMLNPDEAAILLGDQLITQPSEEQWLVELFEALNGLLS